MTIEEFETFVKDRIANAERNRDFAIEDGIHDRQIWQEGYITAMMDVLENIERIEPR